MWDTKGAIYTDQTGTFPVRAQRRNRDVMAMVVIDNTILVAPIKHRTEVELKCVYLQLLQRVKLTGIDIRTHVLDNECSANTKQLIKHTYKLELMPLGCHRRNIVEVGIMTFTSNFVAILSGVDSSFPMAL